MALPNRFYAVAEVNEEACGKIMLRDANYVGQLFVHAEQQGKGVGASLWQRALTHVMAAGGSGEFTVRSSVAAEPVYRRLGFQSNGPVQMQ
jgi:GNAT superfamily N-acetyltransferase